MGFDWPVTGGVRLARVGRGDGPSEWRSMSARRGGRPPPDLTTASRLPLYWSGMGSARQAGSEGISTAGVGGEHLVL